MRAQAQQLRRHLISGAVLALLIVGIAGLYLSRHTIAVLQPVGPVGNGERRMLIEAFLLMLTIVIPVFVLLFTIAWRYRDTNKHKHKYEPNLDGNRALEITWWFIPSALIVVLAIITWHGTFAYDPYKPLASASKTMHVQVVAENGWWLFMYPDQQLASINQLTLPVNQAVQFDITADAPMNSFWIPRLGGQIYAMPGMVTKLNLEANKTGSYYGSSANISGKDFAKMHFQTNVVSRNDFTNWSTRVSKTGCLDQFSYEDMQRNGQMANSVYYSRVDPELFGQIVDKYDAMHGMTMMDHSNMYYSTVVTNITNTQVCHV